jgi:DUF971 family protein
MAPSTDPATIHADRAAGTLTIEWRDDHLTVFPTTTLRWLCPCAYCRGEAGLPGWLDSAPSLTPDQVRLVDIAMVGQYAVAPTWGDGHHTGFYTFTTLREMCPCAACAAGRSSDEASPADRGHAGHAGPGGPLDPATPPAGRAGGSS